MSKEATLDPQLLEFVRKALREGHTLAYIRRPVTGTQFNGPDLVPYEPKLLSNCATFAHSSSHRHSFELE